MPKTFKRILILLAVWFCVHEIIIIADGLHDNVTQSDYIVIFGNTVQRNGMLSNRLKARVDKGLELYKKHKAPTIIVSGGLGKEGYYEGTKMAEYLINKGVPATSIIVDNQGNTTKLTAVNFTHLVPKATKASVIVVTQFYHVSRAKLAFYKQNVSTVYSAHANYFETRDAYSLFREFFGYYKYLLSK